MTRYNVASSLLFLARASIDSAAAFTAAPVVACQTKAHSSTGLFAGSLAVAPAKDNLLTVADRLRSDEGIFILDSETQSELNDAVSELEAVSNPPSNVDYESFFEGDWTLVCTTATASSKSGSPFGKDKLKLPFVGEIEIPEILQDVRKSVNNRLKVTQRISSSSRIDHILEIEPANELTDIIPSGVPEPLSMLADLNLNPLEVTGAKVTLIHKAEVQSVTPVLRTKLGLESVVVSAAGTSQYLDTAGADLLGVNLPLGEFLNAGTFDTTYMDDTLRISRGKVGVVEQLRVFVKDSSSADESDAEITSVTVDETEMSVEVEMEVSDDEKDEESPSADDETATNDKSSSSSSDKYMKNRADDGRMPPP